MSLNKVSLIGNLGQDPEVKMTPSGQQVATWSMATSEKWEKDGVKQEKTEWHRLVAWGKTAELAGKYLHKGDQVYVEGKLQTRSWDDANGVKRYTTEIIVKEITFIGGKRDSNQEQRSAPQSSNSAPGVGSEYDDVPF